MLEILLLYFLGQNISAKARDRGRSGPLFVVLLIAFWLIGEVMGAVVGTLLSAGAEEPNMLLVYGGALAGAAAGAVLAFVIVGSLAPAERRTDTP